MNERMKSGSGAQENPAGNAEGGGGWSSRSVGSHLGHRIFYLLIRVAGRLPAYVLLAFVVAYYVIFSGQARRKADHYLRRRFPRAGFFGRLIACYRMIFGLGTVLVDRAAAGILGPGTLKGTFEDGDRLSEIIGEGKGIILMMSHVGCWQVAMSALGRLDRPIHMLMHSEEGDIDRHYFEHAGEAMPYRVIDPRGYLGGTLEMMAVLKAGGCLSVMGDRVLGSARNVVTADFLGEPADFPASAYKIASATGAPIVVIYSVKTGFDSYALKIAEVIRVPEGVGRKMENYRPYVQAYVDTLATYCERAPFQFFNFFDMWAPPVDDASERG